ncbi:MAG TPA: PaaI family thioesterase [Acidimicrobiales bacterium]|nr:PaaI family thioesterase [Acidimicrobiales bacterium]
MADWDGAGWEQLMPLTKTLGITFQSSEPDDVKARMDFSEGLCTTGGVIHGGALMALADSTGAACAFLNLPEGAAGTTTIESKTNFLRAVRSGFVEARSTPLHAGRKVIVVDTELRDDRGNLVARVTQSQLVLGEG